MNVNEIIQRAYAGQEITKEECIELLKLDDHSPEAFSIRAAATNIVRQRNGNAGYIFAQIGLSCSPCNGNCSFCSFAKDHTSFDRIDLDDDTIVH